MQLLSYLEETSDIGILSKEVEHSGIIVLKCPNCKSENVAQILRGLPDMTKISQQDIDDGKIILGGCLVDKDDLDWHCNACENEWER